MNIQLMILVLNLIPINLAKYECIKILYKFQQVRYDEVKIQLHFTFYNQLGNSAKSIVIPRYLLEL